MTLTNDTYFHHHINQNDNKVRVFLIVPMAFNLTFERTLMSFCLLQVMIVLTICHYVPIKKTMKDDIRSVNFYF